MIYFAECSWAEFTCEVDNKCILITKKCNGVNDCSDGADEDGCDFGKQRRHNMFHLCQIESFMLPLLMLTSEA